MSSPFGAYELLDRIAVGGMAEVYLARSSEPRLAGRTIVVKRMLPKLADNADSVTMFLDEARLGTLLRHPCIVEVIDVGQIAKSWFMALELVDGVDLGQVLGHVVKTKDTLPNALAAFIVARAAEGLHFAHGVTDPKTGEPLGLVHRDVSPQNLLVGRDGAVKVADFGVATSEQQLHQTQTGLVKGKISYMSPEQVGGHKVDRRTDVFALGVTLWEAVTLRRLYSGLSEVEIMKKVYLEQPPPPSLVKPDVDNALETVVMKALTRGRSSRWQTAGEFMAALDAWCAAQSPAPSREALAAWMQTRFPARPVSAQPPAPPADPDTIEVTSQNHGTVDATESIEAPVVSELEPKPPTPVRPRTPLPKGMKLRLIGAPTGTKKKSRDLVLYVEDEEANWQVAELRLADTYELLHASDDQMACEILRSRGPELAAVLMDIQLKGSELDGIALVRLIRGGLVGDKLPSYARGIVPSQIPIFFVTAYAARYSEKELLSVGADKLVTKPVDFNELTLAMTSSLLRRISLPT